MFNSIHSENKQLDAQPTKKAVGHFIKVRLIGPVSSPGTMS